MGMDYFAHGVYGVLLSEHDDKLGPAYQALLDFVADDWSPGDDDALDAKTAELLPPIRADLAAGGLIVPEDAELFFTGFDDDRPGRCDADPEEWLIGLGLFSDPYERKPADPSFRAAARFFSWVISG